MIEPVHPNTPQIPVLIFCRVSTDEQDYEYQLNELREYCSSKNYLITEVIGKTGNKDSNLERIFDLAEKKMFKKLIITSIDRLSRDPKVIKKTIDYLHERKISIVFRKHNFESLDENGEETLMTNLLITHLIL